MFKYFFQSFASILMLCVFSSNTAYGWKIEENFDHQPLGKEPTYSGEGNINWFSGTEVTDVKSYDGRSAALTITKGASGFGEFGGIIKYPSTIKKGGEVWWRIRTYMPNTYDYKSSTFALKFMRTHTRSIATQKNEGFVDLYIRPSGGLLHQIEVGYEKSPDTFVAQVNQPFSKQDRGELASIDSSVILGRWETYEVYMKFDEPVGVYRVWKNGDLVYENTKWATLNPRPSSTGSESQAMYLFTYWNGDAPKTQTLFIDDLVVTNETPATLDSYGNPHIGMGTVMTQKVAPPKPPTTTY